MIVTELKGTTPNGTEARWVDVTAPSADDLASLAKRFALPPQAVQDCLEPEHLPKFEKFGNLRFMIVRAFDSRADAEADTLRELTRKVSIFESPDLILTIHRAPQAFLEKLQEQSRASVNDGAPLDPRRLLVELYAAALRTYEQPLRESRDLLESFEEGILSQKRSSLEDGYFMRRRASAIKRVIQMMNEIWPQVAAEYQDDPSLLQDIRESGARLHFHAEEFYDDTTSLLNLGLSLSSQKLSEASFRANEVMRILTIFSVFFMPLNLITGIYGMNFESMPELRWPWGYAYCLGMMASVTIAVAIYFKGRGILKDETPKPESDLIR
jgi:magnesium transporter